MLVFHMQGFNYKKAVQALNYFAREQKGSIDKLKALKLIWLADRLHLRKYARPIVNDIYYAMKLGPVPSGSKDLIDGSSFLSDEELAYRNQFIGKSENNLQFVSLAKFDPVVFSQTDRECIEAVADHYVSMPTFDLSDLSHKYPERTKFAASLTNGERSRFQMDYEDFFENPTSIQDTFFAMDEDQLVLSKEIFQEDKMLSALL
jgi:uncharacterized phage-associated protein